MSVLAPGTTRKVACERFARELLHAMNARQTSIRGLARKLSVHVSTVADWRSGSSLPSLVQAVRIASELDWPRVSDLVRDFRTRKCESPYCGKPFIDESPALHRRYCDTRCQAIAAKLVRGHERDFEAVFMRRRMGEYRNAIDAMCAACEPEGVCRNHTCPLRAVSPLPLAKRKAS